MKRPVGSPRIFAAFLFASASLTGCGSGEQEEGLEVVKAFATEPVMGERAALYLSIVNHGTFDDVLEEVSSPSAGLVEIHRTVDDGAGSRMEKIGGIPIPSDSTISLRPGGYHIMLLDLRQRFERGDTLSATLRFRMAGELRIRAPVVSHAEIESALEGA